MNLDKRDNPLALEIRGEMVATYFAACKRMVASLEALKDFDRAFGSRTDRERMALRSELFVAAVERVHFMVIQREAMKMSGWEKFFEDYEVPEEVRAQMGKVQCR